MTSPCAGEDEKKTPDIKGDPNAAPGGEAFEDSFEHRLAAQRRRAGLDGEDIAADAAKPSPSSSSSNFALAMRVLGELVTLPALFALVGLIVDRRFDASPRFTLIMGAAGFALALYVIYKTLART